MRVSYLGTSASAAFIAANSVRIPLYSESAGVNDQYFDADISLNTRSALNPAATFFVRAQGESLERENIQTGDVLVVNRSLTARHGDTVVAFKQGRMTVMTLELKPEVLFRPKNQAYAVKKTTPASESDVPNLEVFGVVTSIVRPLERH